MLTLIYKGVQYTLQYIYSIFKAEDIIDVKDINKIISHIEQAEDAVDTYVTKKTERALNKEGCYYKTGYITQITLDYILIDDRYLCDKNDDSTNNLKVGDKVHYLAYRRNSNEELIVRKIINVIDDESWDNTNAKSEEVHTHMIPRSLIAKVIKREGRIVIVDLNNIHIHLDKVHSTFVPLIGDWLTLEALVELNDNSNDLCGEVLEIERIKPLRSKLDIGVISKYNPDSKVGVIDKQVIFLKCVCEPGYIPYVGDKVVSDSIESDQGQYNWRSVTVVPLTQTSNKFAGSPEPVKTNAQTITTNTKPKYTTNFSAILQSDTNELLKNKYGIIIDDELTCNLNIEEESTLTVSIRNNGSYTHMLQGGSFVPQNTLSQLSLESPINTDINTVINPSENVIYTFKCKAKFVGTSEELFIFNFKDFKIGRVFCITVNAKNVSRKPDSASVEPKNNLKSNVPDLDEIYNIKCIPGVKPYKPPSFIKARNGVFKVPPYIWNAVLDIMRSGKSQKESEIALEEQIPCLLKPLSFETYKERLHILLYLEEIAQTLSMQQYEMKSAVMRRCGDYLVLEVPGLVEKRPSLLIGDKAIISFLWDNSQGLLKYEGYIHKIKSTEIFLKFNEKFHHEYNGEHCQVTFKCSKSVLQRFHNAINLALNRLGRDFLFPTKVVQKEPQFYLEEYEVEERPAHRSRSISSNSITSVSDAVRGYGITRISSRRSVAEKLFSVESADSSLEETKTSGIQIETCQNFKMNLARNPDSSKTNIANPTVLKEANKSVVQSDDELEPYITQIKKRKLNWFNKKLNYYQREAVRNILQGLARPLPYVIFGPPGTGKTMTICETILQILTVIPESRLLVATPSNSSANLITERLLDSYILKPGDLVRVIAYHCLDSDLIPERLLPYCATTELAMEGSRDSFEQRENGSRLNCTMSMLGRHRITIGTCAALGVLYNMGFPRGHFTHVLVDEAGQAIEAEIMIPLNFIHSDHGQVILAGDPMQLGPVVHSNLATYFGLEESFLSRLLHQFPYQRDPEGFETGYDPRLVTKLLMNYRSLPEILDLPNSLFYESELQPQISPKKSKEAELLEILKAELPERNGSPPAIVFHGVSGENCRDSESPSWYNPEEATQAYLYLVKLYKYGLEPDDIGIITPYQKQVLQIRDLLLELDLKLPKISSVEGFQGQERKVIILSTVRSCKNLITQDVKHALGFVASPRRLNVAISRARALLIILGNPRVLSLDPYWRNVLRYCIDRNAYTGCNFLPS